MTFLALERFDRRVGDGVVELRHQEDLAQALSLDWVSPDAKFADPSSPRRADRPSAARVGELLGSIPDASGMAEAWLRQLVFHVAIGNNDAHAKNAAILHDDAETSLAPLYDAVPSLYQEGRVTWDLALPINRIFDHRNISAEDLRAEALSWGVLPPRRVSDIVVGALDVLDSALGAISVPRRATPGMADAVSRNLEQLRAGLTIGGSR